MGRYVLELELNPPIGPYVVMQAKGTESIEGMASIIAELKADSKALTDDLLNGINAFYILALVAIIMTLFTGVLALAYFFPGSYATAFESPLLAGAVAFYPVFGAWLGYRALRRYRFLRRKYSRLIEIWTKLGE